MTRTISVAGIQTSYGMDIQDNIDKTIVLIREAAAKGAQVILPPELFQGPYFCVSQQEKWFGAETIVAAERAVRGELKDPDAAQFRDVRANYTEEFGVVACGRVNAKNEFGGYTGFRRFVSGGKSVILEGRDNVADAWAGACL